MKFEGNLARSNMNMPVFDERESKPEKEKELNLENLALEKLKNKEKISPEEKLESYKILFEQDPNLAMELAKKEKHFPITALTKSNFWYFQPEISKEILEEISSAVFKGERRFDFNKYRKYSFEIDNWTKKYLSFEILKKGRKESAVLISDTNVAFRKTRKKSIELTKVLYKLMTEYGDNEEEDRMLREGQLETAENIFSRESQKREKLPEGKNILYQNARAVFSNEGEAGLQKFLERHQERLADLPPHLLFDLHYMRYSGYRKLRPIEDESESKKKTPIELGIAAINLVKEKLESGEDKYQVKTKAPRRKKMAKALEMVLNAGGQTLTESFAQTELRRDFEKRLQERLGVKVKWMEKDGEIVPEFERIDKMEKEKNDTEIPKYFNQAEQIAELMDSGKDEAFVIIAEAEVDAGDFEKAKQTADIIEEEISKVKTLGYIAKAKAMAGHHNQAKQIFDQAEKIVELMNDKDDNKLFALKYIAKAKAMAGYHNQANQIFNQVKQIIIESEDKDSNHKFKSVAIAEAEAGYYEQAKKTTELIKNKDVTAQALDGIVEIEVKLGYYDQAKKTAESIENENHKAYSFNNIATAEAGVGDFKQAKKTAESISTEQESNRSSAFIKIAIAEARAGNFEQARQTGEFFHKEEVFIAIAEAEADAGYYDQAKKTTKLIENGSFKSQVLQYIATNEAESGYYDQAKKTIELIENKLWKIKTLGYIAKAEAGADHYNQAEQTLDQAKQIIEHIKDKNIWGVSETLQNIVRVALEVKLLKKKSKTELLKKDEEIVLSHTEQEILKMMNILKMAEGRPRWKGEMGEDEKEKYGEFYDNFKEKAGEYFMEESRVNKNPNAIMLKVLREFPEKNKLYAQKECNAEEFLANFKSAWLSQFIKPEQKREFDRGIRDFWRGREAGMDSGAFNDPEMAFAETYESAVMGGDPKMEGREIMENASGYNGFLVKNHLAGNGAPFQKSGLEFIEPKRFRDIKNYEFNIKNVPQKLSRLNIPMPPDSRPKKISGKIGGQELEIENQGNGGSLAINLDKKYEEIKLVIEKNQLKIPIHKEIKGQELAELYNRLPDQIKNSLTGNLFYLPAEIKAEIEKIKDLPVREKIGRLQEIMQENFYYDMDYGEWRKSAGKDIKSRMGKSQAVGKSKGKLFAGVCAEANIAMCQALRSAGIVAGIADGLMASGKSIKNTDAHSVAYAVLPNAKGELDIYYIDGTPGGAVEGALPNYEEMEKEWLEEIEKDKSRLEEEESEDLEKMIKYLQGELDLLGEDAEALLNGHLKKITMKGYESYLNIHQTLSAMRFAGLKSKDFEEMDEGTKKLLAREIKDLKVRENVKQEMKENGMEIGESVLSELEKTINHWREKNNLDKKRACEWLKKINKEKMAGTLSVEERALINLAVEYIEKK